MIRTTLALVAAFATALSALPGKSEAGRFRMCIGCVAAGVVIGHHLSRKADDSIMERQNRDIERYHMRRRHAIEQDRRERRVYSRSRSRAAERAAARRAAAAKDAAREAALERKSRRIAARRAAAAAARARQQATASARQQAAQHAAVLAGTRPESGFPSAARSTPAVAATAAAVAQTNAPPPADDASAAAAQAEQTAKARQLVKALTSSARRPAAAPVSAPAPDETVISTPLAEAPRISPPSATAAADSTDPVQPLSQVATKAQPAARPEALCNRFIPGAGITISVPCGD